MHSIIALLFTDYYATVCMTVSSHDHTQRITDRTTQSTKKRCHVRGVIHTIWCGGLPLPYFKIVRICMSLSFVIFLHTPRTGALFDIHTSPPTICVRFGLGEQTKRASSCANWSLRLTYFRVTSRCCWCGQRCRWPPPINLPHARKLDGGGRNLRRMQDKTRDRTIRAPERERERDKKC